MNRSSNTARGFTLVEVLVALIVLSLGLLGISSLILNALKANDSSGMRTQAIILANSMLDSMRGNIPAATGGQYNTTGGPGSATNCVNVAVSAQCSASQIANNDIYNWEKKLAVLPAGTGNIAASTVTGYTTVTITVQWDDTRAVSVFSGCPPAPATCTLTGTTQSVIIQSIL